MHKQHNDIYIAVSTDGKHNKPILEIVQHNIPIKVGTFISEDHAKLFMDIFEQLLKDRDSRRIM